MPQATGMPADVVMSPPLHVLPAGHTAVVTELTAAAATGVVCITLAMTGAKPAAMTARQQQKQQ
jgi:hypothetical protein